MTDLPATFPAVTTAESEDERLKVAALMAAPVVLYGVFFTPLRPLGELPYVLSLVCCIGAMVWWGRIPSVRGQWLFAAISTFWLLMSLFRLLPPAWTVYYEPYAAVRQWSWTVAVPILVGALYLFFRRFLDFIFSYALVLAVAIYAMTRSSVFLFGEKFRWEIELPLYSVNNETAIIQALLFIAILGKRRSPLIDFLLLAFVLFASTSSATILASSCALLLRFVPTPRLFIVAFVAFLVSIISISPFFLLEIDAFDRNASLRALFWRHTVDAAVATNGVGVGFGTEYMKNQFWELGRYTWQVVAESDPGRLYISNHSTLYDVLLRTGVVGLAVFIFSLIPILRVPVLSRMALTRTDCAIVGLIACNICFNPAFVTVDTQIGTAMLLAWVFASRDRQQPTALGE